jgi:hypothetical protein
VHGLEAEWGDRVNFVYLDIDDPNTQPFKAALGYQYQPHLFMVDGDGTVLQQWVGFVDEGTLERALEAATG